MRQCERASRRQPNADIARFAGPVGNLNNVSPDRLTEVNLIDFVLDREHIGCVHNRFERIEQGRCGPQIEEPDLGIRIRVSKRNAHQKPVELALGQRVGAFVISGVLRGDDHEGRVQPVHAPGVRGEREGAPGPGGVRSDEGDRLGRGAQGVELPLHQEIAEEAALLFASLGADRECEDLRARIRAASER